MTYDETNIKLRDIIDNYNLLWAEPLLIAKNSNIKKHKSRILNMIKKMYCIKVAYYAKNRFSITNNTIIVKNELVQFIKSYFTNNKFNIIYESNINIDLALTGGIMRPLKDRFLEIFFSNLKNFDILAQKIARKIIGPYAFKASSVKNIVNFSFLLHQSAAIPYFKQQELLSALN